jgi:type II secretion system protein N
VVKGEAEFGVHDASLRDMRIVGVTLPPLDLGKIRGQITWEGERVDLKEVAVTGRDLEGQLTGNIFYQNPVTKSKLACRLELAFTRKLVDRYPAIAGLSTRGRAKPLIFSIRGTLENPRFSLAR